MNKDLTSRDIFKRTLKVPTRLAQYKFGRWEFGTPGNAVRATGEQTFYLLNSKFGICTGLQEDATKTMFRGRPGDYLAVDRDGVMSVVTRTEFQRLFPVANLAPPYRPRSSKLLRNPKVLTDTLKKSGRLASNRKANNSIGPKKLY